MEPLNPLEGLLERRGTALLDGGLATALEADGHRLDSDLWSAKLLLEDGEPIRRVHDAYLLAGADIVTTATYQASVAGFRRHGVDGHRAREAMVGAARLASDARRAAGREGDALIAASIGPYGAVLADGSEYRGDYGLTERELSDFHDARFDLLATSGVDILAIETIPSALEARVFLRALDRHPERYAWISFTCRDDRSISDGTPIEEVVALCGAHPRVAAIGVNCVPPEWAPALVSRIRAATDRPVIAYPNSGEQWDASTRSWSSDGADEAEWLETMSEVVRCGADVIGGCCRVGPSLIGRLRSEVVAGD